MAGEYIHKAISTVGARDKPEPIACSWHRCAPMGAVYLTSNYSMSSREKSDRRAFDSAPGWHCRWRGSRPAIAKLPEPWQEPFAGRSPQTPGKVSHRIGLPPVTATVAPDT